LRNHAEVVAPGSGESRNHTASRQGQKRNAARDQGMHVLRDTAASIWLSKGADIVAA
jgi:hypothetical protein